MHGELGAPIEQGRLKFFDEQALAAHLGQAAVEDFIATRAHAQQAHPPTGGLQKVAHMLGLPQRQTALTGGDGQGGGHEKNGVAAQSEGNAYGIGIGLCRYAANPSPRGRLGASLASLAPCSARPIS